ncbi:hypothetical protein DL95DRAFT_399083 [Leptodontidium sp. 2 PMI_412]|nr:hypothetical protein DL95DRAFT_399083 [Leptodontidium sp. 2 PMI_412]
MSAKSSLTMARPAPTRPSHTQQPLIISAMALAWYIHGVGLGSTFLDYIFNGITAQDIASQCISAYKFIVLNYTYPDHEIWMFGLSRGAYTVRCVAGMINNCGIVKPVKNSDGNTNDLETDLLCNEVYRIYRSPYPINKPHSLQSENFRRNASWPLVGDEDPSNPTGPRILPPIKFMGLFDTVGSLGLPDFTGGVGLEWPKFYDENVSTVVENVYHAVSLHDNLYTFEPCLAKRDVSRHSGQSESFGITQEWFLGVHYDLGRQRFRFLREFGGGWLERLLARWNWASKVIEPNHVLADLVLKWMLNAIETHGPTREIIPRIDVHITDTTRSITSPNRQIGEGDVYNRIVNYASFGPGVLWLLRAIWGTRGRVSELYQLFFALRDRIVPDEDALVYDYKVIDLCISNTQTIQQLAGIQDLGYPSTTYEAWRLARHVSGLE